MLRRRHVLVLVTALFSLSGVALFGPRDRVAADNLPKQLSDRAFWKMVVDFSEADGFFRSDNFISNETTFQEVIPELKKRVSQNGVYLGVGPDQNFTYITALRPRMAFIVDIRHSLPKQPSSAFSACVPPLLLAAPHPCAHACAAQEQAPAFPDRSR